MTDTEPTDAAPHTFIVNALRPLPVTELASVIDRAALVSGWVGYDSNGDVVHPCDEDDDGCEKPGDCPNGGWCRNPATLHLQTLRGTSAVACWRVSALPRYTGWTVYPPSGGEPVRGQAPTTAEAIEQAEVAAVAAGWRLPWR